MTILIAICGGGWMPNHLSEGWRRLGFSVEEFFYGTHMGKTSWSSEGIQTNHNINDRLLKAAKQLKVSGKLELIFAVIYDDVLLVETAKELRKLDVPMVNYHVDLVGQWYRILKTGKFFDRVACAQRDNWDGLQKAKIRPFYMPMAANPPVINDLPEKQIKLDGVLYLGSPWLYRKQVLARIARSKVPLKIYGRNWQRKKADLANAQPLQKNIHDAYYYLYSRLQQEGYSRLASILINRFQSNLGTSNFSIDIPQSCLQGPYADEDFTALVRGASINLGFTHFSGIPGTSSEQRQVRLREFEIPMHGGFYLTQSCLQFQELFPDTQSSISWKSPNDLQDKVDYYLRNPAERKLISKEVQSYSLKHHTWEARFKSLLKELKLPSPTTTIS